MCIKVTLKKVNWAIVCEDVCRLRKAWATSGYYWEHGFCHHRLSRGICYFLPDMMVMEKQWESQHNTDSNCDLCPQNEHHPRACVRESPDLPVQKPAQDVNFVWSLLLSTKYKLLLLKLSWKISIPDQYHLLQEGSYSWRTDVKGRRARIHCDISHKVICNSGFCVDRQCVAGT